jgi:hypothetical protein
MKTEMAGRDGADHYDVLEAPAMPPFWWVGFCSLWRSTYSP